jgi:hypothetical protein
MSRFDRRLKPELVNRNTGIMSSGISQTMRRTQSVPTTTRQVTTSASAVRSGSPRPGTADCKIRPRSSNQMLGTSVFMGDSTNPSKPSIEVIETSYEPGQQNNISSDIILDNISKRNKLITEKIQKTRDPNVRLLYGHEIRLNTVEGTIDCLNQIKCSEVRNSQLNAEYEANISRLTVVLDTITQELNEMKLKIEVYKEERCQEISQVDIKVDSNLEKIKNNKTFISEIKNEIRDYVNLRPLIQTNTVRYEEYDNKIKELEVKNGIMENKNNVLKNSIETVKNILIQVVQGSDYKKKGVIKELKNINLN